MDSVQSDIDKVPRWRHRIQLPGGIVTPGSQDTGVTLTRMGLPDDLSGKRVLDVGCSDGFFSFECERRGADYVLGIDSFASPYQDSPTGHEVAKKLLRSKVELREIDLFDLNAAELGQFDLILFLGVFYHLRHPMLALEKLGDLCCGQLILETEMARTGVFSRQFGGRGPSALEFYEHDEVNRDPTTWWAPTPTCMISMLRSCGYCSVEQVYVSRRRGVFHGFVPSFGDDVDQLVSTYGNGAVAEGCAGLFPEILPVDRHDNVHSVLRSLSVRQLSLVKDCLAGSGAKQWHQIDKWAGKGGALRKIFKLAARTFAGSDGRPGTQ